MAIAVFIFRKQYSCHGNYFHVHYLHRLAEEEREMTQAPILTGQDIAEAQGAVTRLLERALEPTGVSRQKYVALRVLAVRGPWAPRDLHAFLADQPQLGLSGDAVAELLAVLEDGGYVTGTAQDAAGRAQATPEGTALLARLNEAAAPSIRALYAGFDPGDLAVAHRVLVGVTERAGELAGQGAPVAG
jgi:DNA-binding MarR family transcriptional regulator